MTIDTVNVIQAPAYKVTVNQAPAYKVTVNQAAPIKVTVATAGLQGATGNPPTLIFPTPVTSAPGGNASVAVTGDAINGYSLTFTIPRGNTGATGATGPAPTLNAPTVTTGLPGTAAAATFTGTNPYTLNLTIPRGSVILNGTAAPATGTGGTGDWFLNNTTWDFYEKTAAATWTLRGNIKGAKGDTGNTGATGPVNTLALGTVTASAPGSAPVVSITGTAPNQTISFTLPRGDVGPIGPAPNIAGVSVTTGAAGSSASGSVTGTNPNYTLNLTIPRGDKGDVGAQWYAGAGAPVVGTGVNGDFYLVASGAGVGDFYKKVSGAWVLQGNIRGQAGSGDVESVNGVLPVGGNVTLTWANFTGTIPTSALPSLATVETYTVASQAAMLALSAQRGDLAIRTDLDETYILSGNDPAVLGNWTVLLTDGGNVRLTGDQTVGGIKTFSSAPVVPDASWTIAKTNGLQAALDAKQATITTGTTAQYYRGDKTWQTLDKAAVGLSAVANLAQVDLVNAQTIGGIKTFSSAPVVPDASFTIVKINGLQTALDSKSPTSHGHALTDANITGILPIAQIPTGTTGTTVALGNHLHTGVYEPVIATGTTAQYRRGDNTWRDLNLDAVVLTGNQTIDGIKTFTSAPVFAELMTFNRVGSQARQLTAENAYISSGMNILHDRLRFTTPVFETSPNGTTWTVSANGTQVLDGRSDTGLAIQHTDRYHRWTWNNTFGLAWGRINRLLLQWSYNATPGMSATATAESSVDGTTWTNRGTASISNANNSQWIVAVADTGGDWYFRVTIQYTGGGTSGHVGTLLTLEVQAARIGDSGGGPENEVPYTWNVARQIGVYGTLYPVANDVTLLGQPTNRWTNVYSNNGNFSGGLTAASVGIASSSTGLGANGLTINSDTNNWIEIGRQSGVASTPFIDFHSGATLTDYDARIVASGGTGTSAGGSLGISANGGITLTASVGGVTISNLTASRVVTTGTGGLLGVSTVTTTELGYLSGVTSAIQTQLNGKAATSHTHTKSQITDFAHTHAISEVTSLQAALDLKAPLANPSFTGTVTVGGNLVVGNTDTATTLDRSVRVETDQRGNTMVYTDGLLTSVVEKSGATTVRDTILTYTDGLLTQTVEVAGGKTITTTFVYTDGNLTSTSKVVV